ncbi:MAG: tRNA 2-thiouridine(34) synthase MnmA [Chitinivibrionales bacterium]|nr:tRNA 2-thiouridine(34) synthase MnmA [Chitinivibrionales bacterium]
MSKSVMVAMSGGVDSSVAALLLKNNGYSVTGVTMVLDTPDHTGKTPSRCGPAAVNDARRVCDKLDIPHSVMDFSQQLEQYVVKDFIVEYARGRTPNPCVRCNRYLKFDILLEKARGAGCDFLATGHYAAQGDYNGARVLRRPKDRTKDQTYFLYGIKKEFLQWVVFPLAGMVKSEVRSLAAAGGLPVSGKEESQDICFVTRGSYRDFPGFSLQTPGDIVDRAGNVLGRHTGIGNYTVGQRKGLGIATGTPCYVVRLDLNSNTVIVGRKEDLYAGGLLAKQVTMFTDAIPGRVSAQIRYAHRPAPCRVYEKHGGAEVIFDTPQEAITPGQSVVFSDNDYILGGGIIERAIQ